MGGGACSLDPVILEHSRILSQKSVRQGFTRVTTVSHEATVYNIYQIDFYNPNILVNGNKTK